MLRALLVLMIFACSQAASFSQGLPGIPPDVRGGSKFPPLLPGKSDADRWAILTKNQKRLIGMKRSELVKIFGAGATPETTKEIVYQLTDKPPVGTKNIAYLELSVQMENDTVTRFSIGAMIRSPSQ